MNRRIRMTGVAVGGIALGTAVLGSIPGHSDRSEGWKSLLEEDCRKGTDS
jgi:hypothetical protein